MSVGRLDPEKFGHCAALVPATLIATGLFIGSHPSYAPDAAPSQDAAQSTGGAERAVQAVDIGTFHVPRS